MNDDFFSLRLGDLIRRCCSSVGWSVGRSVLDFVIFPKRGFETIISDLSNTTKLTLLESLLQEVAAIVQLPNAKLTTVVWLPNPKSNSVIRLPNRKFSAIVRLPNPKFSTVVGLPNPKMNTVVWLYNPKLSTVIRLPNPKLSSVVCLPNLLHFFKILPWGLCIYVLV